MQSLKLQVLWLENSLGLAVNQITSDNTFPLTPYYFWPVSEAWEQIRFELDARPWLPEAERIKLLNLVVSTMNSWQESRNGLKTNSKVLGEGLPSSSLQIVGSS